MSLVERAIGLILSISFLPEPGRLVKEESNRMEQFGLILFDHHQIMPLLIYNLLDQFPLGKQRIHARHRAVQIPSRQRVH